MEDKSVNCCVTSPPYWGLRDYGHGDQIGLEKTPEEFIEKLVAVFREVKRVLRDDGTLWLNIGDSYCSTAPGSMGDPLRQDGILSGVTKRRSEAAKRYRPITPAGLKPKDLVCIPWALAKALREPYYTGKVKSEKDRVWLAAIIDGEGCFYVHRRKQGQHAGDGYYRKQDTFSCAIEVANTNIEIINSCYQIAGVGSISRQEKNRRQPIFRWTVRCDEAKQISAEIYPYIVGKRQQCRIVYNLPSNGEKALASWEAMKMLHAGLSASIDFNEPPTLYEQGWFLRQDIIWAKPNPMPESVTDRCTKAHEYIFLLSKSPKYYYDHEAIKVASKDPEDDYRRLMQQKVDNKSMPDEKVNGLRPKNWNGSSFDKGKTGEMKHTRGGRKSGNKERKPG